MSDINDWLARRGLAKYAPRFVAEEIDVEALAFLDDEDLKSLGVPLGPRRKIRHALEQAARSPPVSPSGDGPRHLSSHAADSPGEVFTEAPNAEHARRAVLAGEAGIGERKRVTVLFADLRGSTALIEDLDAEAAVERLRPAVEEMVDAVQRFEGTVNRVQGDGIMALFGAPVAHEDHTLRACLAGIAMRDGIRGLDDAMLLPRVGIHCGEAVVRTLRNDVTVEYEADGPVVHLAARMEQAADPGTVRATAEVWREVDGHVDARSLGTLPVRGQSHPVAQYEIQAPSSAASRWEGRARRGLTRFVGRSREFAVLQRAAGDAFAGDGRVVTLIGEAGMGKSRLLHEFLAGPGMDAWTLRVAAASPHGQRTPYLPLRQLLRAVIGARTDDAPETLAARLASHLRDLGETALELHSPLLALLDQEPGDEQWAALEPAARRRRVVEALRDVALARARVEPLLLVVEDLHWIDDETQVVLDRLVDSAAAVAMLIVTTCRPEYRGAWYGKSYFVPVPVGAMAASGVRELLDELLGRDASLIGLRGDIEARGEGRPLYIEEMVRELVDRGVLGGEPGARRLLKPDAPVRIPDSVQAVIGARIDRLEPPHKRLLQVASVVGRTVPRSLLAGAAETADEPLEAGIAALQGAELLFETQSFPEPEYLFKHALIESVAYEGLLRRERRTIHESVLRALESRHVGQVDTDVELLAHHAYRAGLWPEAVAHGRAAGRKAIAGSAFREAVAQLDQALDALAHVQDSPERAALGIDIRLDLRPALGATAEYGRLLVRLQEARDLAQATADEHRDAYLAADSVHVLYHLGRVREAIDTGAEAMQAARALGDTRALVLARANYSQAHVFHGDFERAIESGMPLVDELRTTLRHERIGTTPTSSCLWLGNLCGVRTMMGEFDSGICLGEEACRIAEETGLPIDRVMAGNWLAWCHALRGESQKVLEISVRNLDLVERNDLTFPERWVAVLYGYGLTAAGEPGRALQFLDESRERRRPTPEMVLNRVWLDAAEASIRLEGGDRDGAAALCESVLDDVGRFAIHISQPSALRVLGVCESAAGEVERGRERIERARRVAEAQGARPEMAHGDLALARLCHEQGEPESGRAAAMRATEAYREMGMRRWLDEANALADR